MLSLPCLPDDALMSVASFLKMDDAEALFSGCKRLRQLSKDPRYWDDKLSRALASSFSNQQIKIEFAASDSKQILRLLLDKLSRPRMFCHNLAFKVIESSSTDRAVERASNVLAPSRCQQIRQSVQDSNPDLTTEQEIELMEAVQYTKCGCGHSRPCYWSSKSSIHPDIYESITFLATSPLSVVYGFSLSPYQACWHPSNPIYAPKEACIELLLPVENDSQVSYYIYYQSPFFAVRPEFREQKFLLDKPVFCFGGLVRLALRGMQQRQTLVGLANEALDGYYVCLNHVSIIGLCMQGQLEYNFSVQGVADRRMINRTLSSSSAAHALISKVLEANDEDIKSRSQYASSNSASKANRSSSGGGGGGGGEGGTSLKVDVKLPSTSAYNMPILNCDPMPSSDGDGEKSSSHANDTSGGTGSGTGSQFAVDRSRYVISLQYNEALSSSNVNLKDCIAAAQEKYGAMKTKELLMAVKELGLDKKEAVEREDLVKLLVRTNGMRQLAILKEAQQINCCFGPAKLLMGDMEGKEGKDKGLQCCLSEVDKQAVADHSKRVANLLR